MAEETTKANPQPVVRASSRLMGIPAPPVTVPGNIDQLPREARLLVKESAARVEINFEKPRFPITESSAGAPEDAAVTDVTVIAPADLQGRSLDDPSRAGGSAPAHQHNESLEYLPARDDTRYVSAEADIAVGDPSPGSPPEQVQAGTAVNITDDVITPIGSDKLNLSLEKSKDWLGDLPTEGEFDEPELNSTPASVAQLGREAPPATPLPLYAKVFTEEPEVDAELMEHPQSVILQVQPPSPKKNPVAGVVDFDDLPMDAQVQAWVFDVLDTLDIGSERDSDPTLTRISKGFLSDTSFSQRYPEVKIEIYSPNGWRYKISTIRLDRWAKFGENFDRLFDSAMVDFNAERKRNPDPSMSVRFEVEPKWILPQTPGPNAALSAKPESEKSSDSIEAGRNVTHHQSQDVVNRNFFPQS